MLKLATVMVKTPDGNSWSEVVDYSDPPPECAVADNGGPIHVTAQQLVRRAMKSYTSTHYLCNICQAYHKKSPCEVIICEKCHARPCTKTCSCDDCRGRQLGEWPCTVSIQYH